jgi:hypothetical protein
MTAPPRRSSNRGDDEQDECDERDDSPHQMAAEPARPEPLDVPGWKVRSGVDEPTLDRNETGPGADEDDEEAGCRESRERARAAALR